MSIDWKPVSEMDLDDILEMPPVISVAEFLDLKFKKSISPRDLLSLSNEEVYVFETANPDYV